MGASLAILGSPTILGATALAGVGTGAASLINTLDQQRAAKHNAADERARLAAEMAKDPAALPDEAQIALARHRSITSQMRRRGRAGSILTNTDTAGDNLGA